jgi:sulfotransferase
MRVGIIGQGYVGLPLAMAAVEASWTVMGVDNIEAKVGVLKSVLQGYYSHIDKPIIVDKDRGWIPLLPQVEAVLDRKIKVIVCVRNPAEILTSFEKLRKENPLFFTKPDITLREGSNIASRAYFYASPEGPMGLSHRNIKDAITMGYLDRFLFIDYNRFCNSPKSQTKRIYEFLELPKFEHDFEKIDQTEIYNDLAIGLPNVHKIKPSLDRTTVNCVEYLGLDIYEQYNREIFWNAWI